jgi:hypothetical protein
MKLLLFVFLQMLLDWKSWAWALTILTGFGVKIAYDLSEKFKRKERVTRWYWLEVACALFITVVVGVHSRPHIETFKSADVRAGLFVVVGIVGYEFFKIAYRFVVNRRMWEQILRTVLFSKLGVTVTDKNDSTDEPAN